jgi:hypothetical protein
MTKNFDKFIKQIIENISFEYNGLLKDEWVHFPNISEFDLKNGIYLDDWDLTNFTEFKQLMKKADSEKRYIFGQAYPYNTVANMMKKGKDRQEAQQEFQKDRQRLMNFYKKFNFIHTHKGWMFRPFKD